MLEIHVRVGKLDLIKREIKRVAILTVTNFIIKARKSADASPQSRRVRLRNLKARSALAKAVNARIRSHFIPSKELRLCCRSTDRIEIQKQGSLIVARDNSKPNRSLPKRCRRESAWHVFGSLSNAKSSSETNASPNSKRSKRDSA